MAETLSHLPWTLAVVGLAVLATMFGIGLSLNDDKPGLSGPRPSALPTTAFPPIEAIPPSPPASYPTVPSDLPSATPSAGASPSRHHPTVTTSRPIVRPIPPTSRPDPTTPSTPAITGTYRVLESWGDFSSGSFIGEVLVTNASYQASSWTVRLRFPQVTSVVTFWIEGAPQGSLYRDGADFVFTSGVKLAGRSTVPLRFHLNRYGGGNYPTACTANGSTCR